jgi:hypothetical protein
LDDVRFRGDFRSEPNLGHKIADYIEGFRSNHVFLVSKTLAYTERSVIDLNRGTIRVTELETFDTRVDFAAFTNPPSTNQKITPDH